MRSRAPLLSSLLVLSGCTPRVPAVVTIAAEPETKTAAPPTVDPSQHRWYGDLKVTLREVQLEPSTPTPEEQAAFDRAEARYEAKQHAWDQANLDDLSRWWRELQCLHLAVLSVGNSVYNSNDAERWLVFESVYKGAVSKGMDAMLSRNDMLSNSRAINYILEASQLLRYYRVGFEERNAEGLQELDERWAENAETLNDHLAGIGASRPALDPENPDDLAACRSFLDTH